LHDHREACGDDNPDDGERDEQRSDFLQFLFPQRLRSRITTACTTQRCK
jgi:hypothetical protein